MKMLLTAAMLALSMLGTAHAEWEILDTGTAVTSLTAPASSAPAISIAEREPIGR